MNELAKTNCRELEIPSLLIPLFKQEQPRELNRIFTCFYNHYYNQFIYMIYNIANKHSFLKGDADFYGTQAFSDALLSFHEKLSTFGFEEGRAKIKTYFFSFCLQKLRAIITNQSRRSDKESKWLKAVTDEEQILITEDDLFTDNERLLQKAMAMLDEKPRNYIQLKYFDKLDKEQIAKRMGIQPGSVNSEVYKAMQKLREKIDFLKSKV